MFPSIYYPTYTRFAKYYFLRDKPAVKYSPEEKSEHAGLLFHIAVGDYMMTLATILRFFEESIPDVNTTADMRELQLKTIKGVINDLLYLNKNYVIVPKGRREMNSYNAKSDQKTQDKP